MNSMEEKMIQASRLAVALAYEDSEAGIVRDTTIFGEETSDRAAPPNGIPALAGKLILEFD